MTSMTSSSSRCSLEYILQQRGMLYPLGYKILLQINTGLTENKFSPYSINQHDGTMVKQSTVIPDFITFYSKFSYTQVQPASERT